jgi:hypothetical protein
MKKSKSAKPKPATPLKIVGSGDSEPNLEGLSGAEAEKLADLEATVGMGFAAFLESGSALLEIRDGRLYRSTHRTFAEYLSDRWGLSKQRAHQVVTTTLVMRNLEDGGSKIFDLPLNEAQVQPLIRLKDPGLQRQALELARKDAAGGKVTAKLVEQAAEKVSPRGPKKARRHNKGSQIPGEHIDPSPSSAPASPPTTTPSTTPAPSTTLMPAPVSSPTLPPEEPPSPVGEGLSGGLFDIQTMQVGERDEALGLAFQAIEEYARDDRIRTLAAEDESLRLLIDALAFALAYHSLLAHPGEDEEIETLQGYLRPLLRPDGPGPGRRPEPTEQPVQDTDSPASPNPPAQDTTSSVSSPKQRKSRSTDRRRGRPETTPKGEILIGQEGDHVEDAGCDEEAPHVTPREQVQGQAIP